MLIWAACNGEEAKRAKVGGAVTLVGAPEAQAQGLCRISGVRAGVDGNYRVKVVAHGLKAFWEFDKSLGLHCMTDESQDVRTVFSLVPIIGKGIVQPMMFGHRGVNVNDRTCGEKMRDF